MSIVIYKVISLYLIVSLDEIVGRRRFVPDSMWMFCGKILASRISCARLCFDLCCEKFHFLGKVLLSLKIMTFML